MCVFPALRVPLVTLCCLADLYVCAVLLCCVGILSVLLFTLAIAWQSVLSKRKPRGKRADLSGTGAQAKRHWEGAGLRATWAEKGIVRQELLPCV